MIGTVLISAALFANTASAAPTNFNSLVFSFKCDNGVTFDGIAVAQNHSSTGHVLDSSEPSLVGGVFQAKYVVEDGAVVRDIPASRRPRWSTAH